ncbi:MAG TPA: transcription termination factor Rho [Clostridiaceae bacterium]|nr:transcription termination factor Rho [Clostridiaceae bacterium]
MSLSKLKGKTKRDLVEIAHLAGLLTPKETNRMTKAQILEFLQKIEEESETQAVAEAGKTTPEKSEAEPEKTINKRTTGRTKKTELASKDENQDGQTNLVMSEEPVSKESSDKSLEESSENLPEEISEDQSEENLTEIAEESSEKNLLDIAEEDSDDEKNTAKSNKRTRTRRTKATDKKIIELKADSSEQKSKSDSKKSQANDSKDQTTKDLKEPKEKEELEIVSGILEIMPDNYGFLRVENYLQSNNDVYVPPQFIRRFNLRDGDKITGPCKDQRDADRYRALTYIDFINEIPPEQMHHRKNFDRLTPIYPNEKYILETDTKELSTRMIDLVSPIGKGQRGMIVSPPKAGKTILLQKIANAISINNPDTKLFVLLIDERPEEVTDMQRSIKGEVVYSTFDKTPENHVKVTELVLARAMRLVELGQDVVILLDSITRMSRAYNLTINPTGRTLSGGLDPGALYGPKRFFGAARNIENGGSLTIIATALVETGSRMDEVIFEEFKGTGNMEVYLDRKLAERRIFPAIDLNRSSTRREELLMKTQELNTVWAMRKAFSSLETAAVTETMISLLLKTKNNEQFTNSISISLKDQDLFEAMRGSMPKGNDNNGNNKAG